ncbi:MULTISPECIES: TonB-dependent receptor [unclassified Paraflavitalea]|uniref:TonB-dependent receptor n=1 Tax=unclassified Paraflavitalea TaxID=2798305 RepID=UPI003D3393FD
MYKIRLIDLKSNQPVSDFTLLNKSNFQLVNSEQGVAFIKAISSDTLELTAFGYESQQLIASKLTTQKINLIYLSPSNISLKAVSVVGTLNKSVFRTISDLDIHTRPIANSQEVLRIVPGLFIGQHAGGGKAEQLFLRGFDVDHGTDVSITVDGMPVNMVSHAHGQGYADLHFLIPEMIDRVNFGKGPYTAEKGNLTTAGFVDFKTKDLLENNFVKIEGGQFNTGRIAAGVNLISEKKRSAEHNLLVAGELSYTDGYFDVPQYFSRFNGIVKYTKRISESSTIHLQATGFKSKWDASGQIPDRAVAAGLIGFYGAIDSTEGGATGRYNVSAGVKTDFKNGAHWQNQLYYSKYKFELYSNFTFFKNDPVNGDQIRQKEDRTILGWNSNFQTKLNRLLSNAYFKAGFFARVDYVNDIELSHTKLKEITLNRIRLGDVHETNSGAYASLNSSLGSKWEATAGLRFDYFTNYYFDKLVDTSGRASNAIFSPKFQLQYTANKQTKFYLYLGRGFHSNDTRVTVVEKRKALPAAYGVDLGMVTKIGPKLLIQTAVWYLMLDQEFIYVGDEGVVEAGGKTKRIGFDLSARYELAKNLFAEFDMNLAKPRSLDVPKAESYIPLAPIITSTGGFTYKATNKWNGSFRYRYMGDRPADEFNQVIAKGYFVADLLVNYTQEKWDIGLSVQNLFNTKWKETQFNTESKLYNEVTPVTEIHFTPGTPLFAKLMFTVYFK